MHSRVFEGNMIMFMGAAVALVRETETGDRL